MTFKDQFLLPYTCNIRVLFLNKVFLLSLKKIFFYNNNNNYNSNNNDSNNNNNNNNNGFIQHFHKVALHLLALNSVTDVLFCCYFFEQSKSIKVNATLIIENVFPQDNTPFQCRLSAGAGQDHLSTVKLIMAGKYFKMFVKEKEFYFLLTKEYPGYAS